MKEYRIEKTTMGHKIRVHMSEEEIMEREIFHMAVILLPFIFSALMFFIWVKVG